MTLAIIMIGCGIALGILSEIYETRRDNTRERDWEN